MLKQERQLLVQKLISEDNITSVNEIAKVLKVSDMTVRRDLADLEDKGLVERVHGGAISKNPVVKRELSHDDKLIINIEKKKQIANYCLSLIEDNDIIFLGPGTTVELLASILTNPTIMCVTNCLLVYQQLVKNDLKAYLLGGEIRKKTQSFVGELTMESIQLFSFHKAFISCNAATGDYAMTSTISEGATQASALDGSDARYLLIDSSKIGAKDFYKFYKLSDFTQIITEPAQEVISEFIDSDDNIIQITN